MIPTAEELDPSKVTPGAWGFFFFAALLVAGFFLFRSMRKQINRIDFVEEPDPRTPPEDSKQA